MFRRKIAIDRKRREAEPQPPPPPYEAVKEKKKTVGKLRKELADTAEKNFEKIYHVYKELLNEKTTTEKITEVLSHDPHTKYFLPNIHYPKHDIPIGLLPALASRYSEETGRHVETPEGCTFIRFYLDDDLELD